MLRHPVPKDFRIEVLGTHHIRESFSSGVSALDTYFLKQAGQDVRRRVATCFVLIAGETIAGYYTLTATSILLTELPEALKHTLPRYPAVPATLMGRLAVDHRYHGRGFGELMLFDAFSRTLRSEIARPMRSLSMRRTSGQSHFMNTMVFFDCSVMDGGFSCPSAK